MGTTPMIAPDGSTGDIPTARVSEATNAGFKPATAMTSPDGQLGYIPNERVMDAAKSGFKPVPVQSTDQSTMTAAPSGLGRITSVASAVGNAGITNKFPYIHPLDAMNAGAQAVENQIPNTGIVGNAKEMAFGGQAVGKPMGTSSGAINSPVTNAMAAAPGIAKAVPQVLDLSGQLVGATGRGIVKATDYLTGVPKAVQTAEDARNAELATQEAARNANISKYRLAEQTVSESNQAQDAKYQQDLAAAKEDQETARQANISRYQALEQENKQAQNAATQANISRYKEAEQEYAEKAGSLPPAAPGEQQQWRDINNAIRVPANSVKMGRGAISLDQAASMPGRGLAREGFTADSLAKMSPMEQSAALAPKWKAAGQAVEDTAKAASAKGATLDVGKSAYGIFDSIPDPNLQEKAIDTFNDTARSLGIENQRAVTPTQALEFRRALRSNARFTPQGDLGSLQGIGAQLYRSVSRDLHDAVPELLPVDRHYSDLTGAMTTIQKNVARYATNLVPPAPRGLTAPNYADYKPGPPSLTSAPYKPIPSLPERPTPETLNVSPYKPLPGVSPPTDVAAIRAQQASKAALKGGKYIAGATLGYGVYSKLRDLMGGQQ
jgi:hypothetical protein